MHSFLSPLSNSRADRYGGDLAGRMRFPLEVVEAVRTAWPADKPLFFRISSVDGVGGPGWQIEDSVELARALKARGVDVIDCSSGGISGPVTSALVPRELGFQVPYAAAVRRGAGIATQAVGLILDGPQAEAILQSGAADLVAVEPPLSPSLLGLFRGPSEGEPCLAEDGPVCRSIVLYRKNLARFTHDRAELAEQVGTSERRMRAVVDALDGRAGAIRGFVLPGGGKAGSLLHVARQLLPPCLHSEDQSGEAAGVGEAGERGHVHGTHADGELPQARHDAGIVPRGGCEHHVRLERHDRANLVRRHSRGTQDGEEDRNQ